MANLRRTLIVQRFYKLSHSALDTDREFLGPKKARRKIVPCQDRTGDLQISTIRARRDHIMRPT